MRLLPLLPVLCLAGLGACIPYPREVQLAPAITGKVTRGGVPVHGASVVYDRPDDVRLTEYTDDKGEFAFLGARGRGVDMLAPNHCVHELSLYVLTDEEERGVVASIWGACADTPAHLLSRCDLEKVPLCQFGFGDDLSDDLSGSLIEVEELGVSQQD